MAEKTIDEEVKPQQIVSDTIEQRKASLRYYNENYYSEFAEIYRNLNGRTKPLKKLNAKTGEWEDDHDRTNVCTPDHFVMQRRGVARLTRNPPNLRVRGGPDNSQGQAQRDKVSAKLMWNWDRAESQKSFKQTVSITYGLGWGMGKVYYDEVPVVRRLRRLSRQLQPADFDNLANSGDPKIAALVTHFGDRLKDETPFDDNEMSQIVAAMGDEASLNVSTFRYKGPVLDNVFIGDMFGEPGFKSANESAYWIENSMRDKEWLQYWLKQKSINPVTGEEKPVFDAAACEKTMEKAGNRTYIDTQEMTLRRHLRDAIDLADPITAGKPVRAPKKRFMVDERHAIVGGHLCTDFVGEESEYLGRLWYPWETYGRYQYVEMVMIPDWLGGIGMSTLRVTRFLQMLRNQRLNQTTDFINNILLPLLKARSGSDITAYDIVRTGWGRLLMLDNLNDMEWQQDPRLPAEAWQDQAQLQQQMQQADPSTIDFAPGTSDVAQAGKFATTARLAAQTADSVTADTLDQIGQFIREVVELELWMDQQAMNENVKVPDTYFKRINAQVPQQQTPPQPQSPNPLKPDFEQTDAISINNAGAQARVIDVTPMDMQEDYEILPEQGSTLSADDEFKVKGLQQMFAIGERHPDIINLRAVCTKLAEATPGINPEDIILPPPPPQPPVPPVKMNISVSVKWEELPPDVQAAILGKEGLPTELTHAKGIGKMIEHASDAADAAANLEAPVDHSQPQGKPNGSAK
jgi:hypothetical protein